MSQYPKLYNSAKWKRRRKDQLMSNPLCRYCLERGRTTIATVADHLVRHRGDPHSFYGGELQSLCKQCHDSTKQREENKGFSLGCDESGIPTDRKHHWHRGGVKN